MNTRLKFIAAIIFYSAMMTGCSNYPEIISATDDQLILKAKPESYLDAYDIATKECGKNARIAQYITDGTDSLDRVAFNCFDPNPEADVVAEAEVDAESETDIEAKTTTETESEENVEENSEEIQEESLEAMPSEGTATQ